MHPGAMQLHPASLAVGAALTIGVGLLSAQQIVGSPVVEVKVIELPDDGLEVRAFPLPPLNGSSSLTIGPSETAILSTIQIQWIGDPALINSERIRLEFRINGVLWGSDNYSSNLYHPRVEGIATEPVRLLAGDVVTVDRVPKTTGVEAPPTFAGTLFLTVEQD